MTRSVPDRLSLLRLLPLGLAFAGAALGCEPQLEELDFPSVARVGSIGFNLTLPDNSAVDTVNYNITGPSDKKGSLPVAGAGTTFTAQINGLKAGTGYNITLSGTRTQNAGNCFGSGRFDIQPNQTTSVKVKLSCPGIKGQVGSVQISGQVNVCPVVDSATGGPIGDGTKLQLSSSVRDEDAKASAPLETKWVAPKGSGTFSDASAGDTLFQCAVDGPVNLEINVSDGDCGDMMTVPVTCSRSKKAHTSSMASVPLAGAGGDHAKAGAGGAAGSDDPRDAAASAGAAGAAGH